MKTLFYFIVGFFLISCSKEEKIRIEQKSKAPKIEKIYFFEPDRLESNIIQDPEGIVNRFEEILPKIIDILEGENTYTGAVSINGIEGLLLECKSALSELNKLKKSETKYYVGYYDNPNEDGYTYYNGEYNRIESRIRRTDYFDFGLVGHELKHMYQNESGQLDIQNYNGRGLTKEEYEAYLRQFQLEKSKEITREKRDALYRVAFILNQYRNIIEQLYLSNLE